MKRTLLSIGFLLLFVSAFAQTRQYTNPILKPGRLPATGFKSVADPFVFKDDDGTYYLYVTGAGFPAFSSKDLVNWKFENKVLEREDCKWSKSAFWAPEVIKHNGKYYLHYTGAEGKDEPKRIGMAIADNPLGPFEDLSNKPFFEHASYQGCIDSHIFIDDDKRVFMYYSNAMSTNKIPKTNKYRSEIWVVELAGDLSKPIGKPQMLIYPTQAWENNPNAKSYWNEGATVLKHNGIYYLMYSANCFCADNYSIGYATASSPTGPFTKYEGNPIFSSKKNPEVSGPGHHSVVSSPDGTELYCIYHSRIKGSEDGGRMINIDKMGFRPNGELYIEGPTSTPQPYPSNGKK
jgi:beta-xylosidase